MYLGSIKSCMYAVDKYRFKDQLKMMVELDAVAEVLLGTDVIITATTVFQRLWVNILPERYRSRTDVMGIY
ncbi:hypothetical protein VTN77DRAFT_1620 [Rasamsonia byssochlamydoides]|uniref:uncharacterized protein n=1 Tax=Rasamsonia byssochlamydoides TaxID=89139 RepID=UPI0037428E18